MNERGCYEWDASEEYQILFPECSGDLTEGWRYENAGMIETKSGSDIAWRLIHPTSDIEAAAFRHETGIEIVCNNLQLVCGRRITNNGYQCLHGKPV